jgi:DNA mismatch repair protein MutS2
MTRKYKEPASTTPPANEVHLRHLTVDEALLKLDKFIHDAFMAGLIQVRVVHGKGTGTLRRVVKEALAKHPLVKSYRLGVYGEGEAGVTIVELDHR